MNSLYFKLIFFLSRRRYHTCQYILFVFEAIEPVSHADEYMSDEKRIVCAYINKDLIKYKVL
jgi:hypothetical protein